MFHLAPVGLDLQRHASKEHHYSLQQQCMTAIQNCKQCTANSVWTHKDNETRELVKALDAFFCHGFLIPPKSYWRFVREFLPQSIQQSLELEWDARTERSMSIAWLKNALNQQSLHFQMLAFITQPKLLAKYFEKNACIRNIPVLKRIAVGVGELSEVQFQIESSEQQRLFDAPVAQLSFQTPIIHVPSSSAIVTRSMVKSRAIREGTNEIILSASFQHADYAQRFPTTATCSIAELVSDLPRVDVPSSANEPFLSIMRDQNCMIDEMVKTHRIRVQSRTNPVTSSDDEDAVKRISNNARKNESRAIATRSRARKRSSQMASSLANRQCLWRDDRDDCSLSSSFSTTSTDEEAERRRNKALAEDVVSTHPIDVVEELEQLDKPIPSLHDELNNTASSANDAELPTAQAASPTAVVQFESPRRLPNENVDGDIVLSSGEIIQMSLDVFKENVEKFQRLFAIYIGHAVGQPKRRFLLLTNRYVYVLSLRVVRAGKTVTNFSRAAELSYLSSTPAMDDLELDESDKPDAHNFSDSLETNYQVEVSVPLEDIDYVTMGVDAQSVCINTKTQKFKASASDHEQKQFVVETASQLLGACIVSSLQRTIRKFTRKHSEIQIVSGTTLYSIILRNFVRRELGLSSVDLKHGTLIYWLQCAAKSRKMPQLLEGYLFTRNFYTNAWRRKVDKWSQKYFMLDRSKLYQFTDSSCKSAEFLLNVRERIEEVVELELKGDEKFVLELRFNDDTPNLQLSFTTADEKEKWMKSLLMILSTATQDDMRPVACAMILTDTTMLFAQEGDNCQVDGFMRLLLQITFRDIAALATLDTARHHLLFLRRESGDTEIVFLRNEAELQRLCVSFSNFWQLNVEELSEVAAQSDPVYSRPYTQCCQLSDVWSPEEENACGSV